MVTLHFQDAFSLLLRCSTDDDDGGGRDGGGGGGKDGCPLISSFFAAREIR